MLLLRSGSPSCVGSMSPIWPTLLAALALAGCGGASATSAFEPGGRGGRTDADGSAGTDAAAHGSFIYAYDVGVLGFDIVFKRGLGDCLAGCTENDYQYFSTTVSCQPVKVGHYHAGWGAGACLTVDGAPMWTHPASPDPLTVC